MTDELSSDVPQTEYKKFEDKLILLYLINKMDLPLSNNQITMFAVADNKMELFVVQQNLSEMTQSGHLEKFQNNNATRYSITEEGANVLEYFEKQIPQETRNKINKYVTENRKVAKKDYDVDTSYIFDHSINEYLIRCGVYENDSMLMEVKLYVVSKEQAQFICGNWKANVQQLYSNILTSMITSPDASGTDRS